MSKTVKVADLPDDTEALLQRLFRGKPNGFRRFGDEGVVLPRSYEDHADAVRAMDIWPDDVWLVTYPRSGTTMTCEILWLMMNNLDYEKAAKTHMFHRRHFIEFFTFLHEQSQDLTTYPSLRDFPVGYRLAASSPSPRLVVSHLPLSLLPPNVLDVAKVVFVARDPRDVAVSWYHLLRLYRCFDYVGNFKQFWKLFMEDSILFTPYFPRLKQAWALRNHPNMMFGEGFIRKGKSGGWRAYFDEDMQLQAEDWIKRHLAGTDFKLPSN